MGNSSVTTTLTILLRRSPGRDRQENGIALEGYEMFWLDGAPVGVAFDGFCRQGQRLLGLGKYLAGCPERVVQLVCIGLSHREAPLTRIPGCRVRRLCLCRTGRQGRLHFLNGAPTTIVLDLDRDESRVLEWFGLPGLGDGESRWFDLAVRSVQADRVDIECNPPTSTSSPTTAPSELCLTR